MRTVIEKTTKESRQKKKEKKRRNTRYISDTKRE